MEDHVVEPQHARAVSSGLGGSGGQHQDPGMVCAQIEFGCRADHSVGVATVGLAGANGESTGQRGTGQRYHHQITNREIGCTTNNLAILPIADIYRAGPDRLLVAGELLDIGHPPHGHRAVHRTKGDDLFDLVADAQQRLLEFAWGNVPARSADRNHLAQPAVG
ncbi:Uncharacterised protein [Mycobacterium tuberculosis]|uniref:Uncharacterized protein n=2 Tax=Mycobacterium tuberculosis TaxID=1773 RepID=A0A0T9YKX3_MYCTX|nr:Uncharacterised protein [Mycobacterium tuberculosis]CFE76884.1 Uncharacterised protein [Mycobacterium tuberculosis]CFR42102.1 Uncharacterised protein [Mycobacterium tuberculosis]CFR89500.1 Uncharacterised protein [Mycobacterium tuberculosis]CFS02567.1 Uncharacterised protein [Mycobacterium tuberculosis]